MIVLGLETRGSFFPQSRHIFNTSFNLDISVRTYVVTYNLLFHLLWILLRLKIPTKKMIPSWTGVKNKVRDKVIVMQSDIGFN